MAIGAAAALLSIFDLCPFVIITDDHTSSDKVRSADYVHLVVCDWSSKPGLMQVSN